MRPLLMCVLLAGCGKDYCGRTADLAEDCALPADEADLEACDAALDACSGADRKALDDFLDCAIDAGLYDCPMLKGTATGDAAQSAQSDGLLCNSHLTQLSKPCVSGFNALAAGGNTNTAE